MSNFITKRLRKQKEMNDELASSADSAANAVGSVGNVVLQAKTMGAAPDISKQGPLNKYEDPAYVAQADQNAFIMQNFVQGLKEGEDEADKKKGVFEKRAYLKKEYTGNKDSYEGFQKKGLLNKVEGEENPNIITDKVKYKRGKAKGTTKYEFKEERDTEGNVIGHNYTAYDRKGNIRPKQTNSGGTLAVDDEEEI